MDDDLTTTGAIGFSILCLWGHLVSWWCLGCGFGGLRGPLGCLFGAAGYHFELILVPWEPFSVHFGHCCGAACSKGARVNQGDERESRF